MSDLHQYRLTAISLAFFTWCLLGSAPAMAKEIAVAIDDVPVAPIGQKSVSPSSSGLNIGLQPIIVREDRQNSKSPLANDPNRISKQPLGLGLSARVGTLGIGVDVSKSLTSQLNGRLGFNFGNVNLNRTDSGINYDSQLNLSSIQLFGDYYPFTSSNFRLTGGLVAQNNKFTVTSKSNANGTYTIDGTQYQATDVGTLNGEFKYANSIAPYLGIGLGNSTREGFGFNADLGVMFTGSAKVALNASNPAFNNNPTTRSAIDNQSRQTENDLKGFNVYPVLSIGISYGF
jgi:hypothetical protein